MSDPADPWIHHLAHRALQRSSDDLVRSLERTSGADQCRGRALVRWFGGFGAVVDDLVTIEDRVVFPFLAARVPTYHLHADQVRSDHDQLRRLVRATGTALDHLAKDRLAKDRLAKDRLAKDRLATDRRATDRRATDRRATDRRATDGRATGPGTTNWQDAVHAAAELRALLVDHLDLEDQDVLPLFERHVTADEYDVLLRRALATVPRRRQPFALAWLAHDLDPVELERARTAAGPVARSLWRVARGPYRHLVAAALDRR